MIKAFFNQRKESEVIPVPIRNLAVAWIEIPVNNLNRAIRFYENVFSLSLKKQMLANNHIALFKETELGIKGCLIQSQSFRPSRGIRLVFFINIMFEVIEKVKTYGGTIINQPSLLKQTNDKGEIIIGENLIDQQIGYICEITDSEGNGLLLYSHS